MDLCMVRYGIATQEDAQWLLNDKAGRLVDQLADFFESVYLVLGHAKKTDKTFYPNGRSIYTYSVKSPNVEIIATPTPDSKATILKKTLFTLFRLIPYSKYINSSDFVYITLPGFSPFIAHVLCRIYRKPYCLYFGSDWQEVAAYMANWQGLFRLFFKLYVSLSVWAEKKAVSGSSFTLVTSKSLARKFEELNVPIVQTLPMITLSRNDFYFRRDTCTKSTLICLYVGALIPRKGIEYLIEAIRFVRKRGYAISLRLVGPVDAGYLRSLSKQVSQFKMEKDVEIIGPINDLERLLQHYREADLFALASSGEGFPRVIYEAMSQGLPVVASKIDTISGTLEHEKELLFAIPRDSKSFAENIERLITDGKLRRRLITCGYAFAEERIGGTETPGDQVVRLMKQYTKLFNLTDTKLE